MKMDTLQELYIEELKDLHSAERQILKALPTMIEKATDASLKQAFQAHLGETKNQVTLFRDVNSSDPTALRAANAGGQYLSVSYFETTDLAFVDPNTGKLKVRPTVNP